MDGSRHAPGDPGGNATRIALTVDRDAVGLMRHASQTGHLIEWWLQGAATMSPLEALRLGRKLERFRLAARLAEGKASRQVQSTLDALREELLQHQPPREILAELDCAARESSRLATISRPPPTLYREAFQTEPQPAPAQAQTRSRPARQLTWFLLLLLASVAAAAAYLGQQGFGDLIARLPSF